MAERAVEPQESEYGNQSGYRPYQVRRSVRVANEHAPQNANDNHPSTFNAVEIGLLLGFTGVFDAVKFLLGFIPLIDLLGVGIWFFGWCILNVYFLVKLGGKYFGGKKGALKALITGAMTVLGGTPVIGDFFPELFVQALSIIVLTNMEAELAKKEAAMSHRR